jgi:hypothetical protein
MTMVEESTAAAEAEWLDGWTAGRPKIRDQACRPGP